MVIPALHDAANDRPIGYTPVCAQAAGVPVCLNPAYRRYLPEVAADLRPVLAEVAGLPGAPARVAQVAGRYTSGDVRGPGWRDGDDQRPPAGAAPAARRVQHAAERDPRVRGAVRSGAARCCRCTRSWARATAPAPRRSRRCRPPCCSTPACRSPRSPRRWTSSGCRTGRGKTFRARRRHQGARAGPPRGPVYAAARRLAALPAAARHAWLAAHLAALRSGQLTLATAAMTAAGVQSPPPGAVRAPLADPARRRLAAAGLAVPGQPPRPGRPRAAGGSRRPALGGAALAVEHRRRTRRTAADPADDRDRGRRGHRGHHPRPVRRPRTRHRPLAALAAAGRRRRAHRRRVRRAGRRGRRRGRCPAAPSPCSATSPG